MFASLNHHDLSLTITIVYQPVEQTPASRLHSQPRVDKTASADFATLSSGATRSLYEADEAWWLFQEDDEL